MTGVNDGVYESVNDYQINVGQAASLDNGWSGQTVVTVNGATASSLSVTHIDNIASPDLVDPNLLIISSDVPGLDQLLHGVNSSTRVVIFDPNHDSLVSIEQMVANALHGEKAGSIGLATQGNESQFELVSGVTVNPDTITNPEIISFMQSIAANIDEGGYFDLLACNVASGSGTQFVDEVQTIIDPTDTIVHVDASTDRTGNPDYSGNWVMEYGAGNPRDVKPLYFDSGIDAWYYTLAVDRAFTVRYSNNVPGNITFAGNSIETATNMAGDNTQTMSFIDVDSNGTTFNSSSGTLTLPNGSSVLFAGLYWGGGLISTASVAAPNASANNIVSLATPTSGGAYSTVTASQVDTDTASVNFVYSAFADITSIVQSAGAGTYTVANIQASTGTESTGLGNYGGWSIIVVYQDNTQQVRNLTVFDGFAQVSNGNNQTITVSGFQTPINGAVSTQIGSLVWEGDLTITGDSLNLNGTNLSDAVTPSNNVFNSNMSILGTNYSARNPNNSNTFGVDTKIIDASGILGNNVTSTTVQFTSTGDTYFPQVMTFANILNSPLLTATKTVSNLTHPGGPNHAGDVLQYSIVVTNTGTDTSLNSVLTDVIPTNSTYLANSLSITNGANSGAKTDASGDDQAYFDSGANTVHFNLGTGATSSSGGTLLANATTTVQFDVTINSTAPDGSTITNTATVQGVGQLYGFSTSAASSAANAAVSNPMITLNSPSITEGNSGTKNLTFTATLSSASNQTITVNWATADNTATVADNDYNAGSGTLTFTPGQTSKTFNVVIRGDTKYEANETFYVNLSSPTNAQIGTAPQGVGTILNDDTTPTVQIVSNVTHNEGNSGTTPYVFTVSLSAVSGVTTTVDYATADGTATVANNDYIPVSGTLTFAPGVTSQTVTVYVVGDLNYEQNETFTLNLSNPVNATISTGTRTGTITNDDSQPTISINSISQNEGNTGTTPFTFTVSLSAASYQTITVHYATADGTATTADGDNTSASGTLTFSPGQTSQTVTVNVNGDTKYEANETFTVGLSAPTNSTIATGTGTGTIVNDDSLPAISINDVSQNEGNTGTTPFTFTVSLSNPSYQTITVNYATADGTATIADSDYAAASGTLTFTTGQTSKTVTVNVNGDLIYESNETFTVGLSSPTNATIATGTGTGTIVNDDTAPTLSINSVSIAEGNSGTQILTFTVTRTGLTELPATFNYATADNTATVADNDYVAASGTRSIAAGGATGTTTVNVTINGDTKYEPNETFFVNLTNPGNATITTSQGTGTINNDDSQPTISINNVSQNEGNSGNTPYTFTVSLSNASYQTITVNYATADGTATLADSDYTAASGTLTFSPGTTSQTVTVNVIGDTKFEPNETFTVGLSAPTNATISTATGTGTIVNDDSQPTISINSVSQNEGNSGNTPYTFTVSLSNASYQTITVNYATADGTATLADSDYTAASGTLTFSPGTTSQTVTVNVTGDTKFETNETFTVGLSAPTNSTISTATGTGTIVNDDTQPTISINSVSQNEGNSGNTPYTFTVSLSNASYQTITVNYATADGTATVADSDYTAASGTLTFSPGTTSQTVTVNVTGDTKFETNETFTVGLSAPTNATITTGTGTGTIVNDDTQPTISINSVSQNEGNSGNTPYTFTVSLSNASYQTITVNYATADGTATLADSDYTAASGTLTFSPGTTSQTVTVNVIGDTKFEPNETFTVGLSTPTNATIATGTGTGTIVNDDTQPTISINNVSQNEGNSGNTPFTFTVSLSNASYQTITVNYATADGTATLADSDYAAASGTLTFSPGTTSQTVTVNVIGDTKFEPNETFTVGLSAPTNATIATGTGTGTIINDDGVPAISINNVSQSEGNSGNTPFTFTVSLNNSSSQTITVNYATADGTATTADNDYAAASGTLTFSPGTTSQMVTVNVKGDTIYETNETFTVGLSTPTNASIATGTGTGTIINDDTAPTLSINNVSIAEGNSGTQILTFTVTRTGLTELPVTFNYATADNTATVADNDYVAASGTGTIAAGGATGTTTVNVTINGDTKFEPDETFFVNLTNPSNATITVMDPIF